MTRADSWRFSDGARQPRALRAGDRFAERFVIRSLLGQGGMGVVFRAHDESVGRDVALKVLLGRHSEVARARFAREGRLAATLRHPGIVRVHSSGEHEGLPYLACELVEGRSLDWEILDAMDVEDRLDLLLEVTRAVAHAHERGVVHRDLKPANILLDEQGRPRVADFGLALGSGLERLTSTGAMVGTPLYMAPELVTGAKELMGTPTDVWALGVLLYRALTGEFPFDADSLGQLQAQICKGDPTPPRELAPEVTPELAAVCLTCLAKAPDRRYEEAGYLAADLERALEGAPVSVGSASGAPLRWIASGAALVGALLVGAFALLGGGGPPASPEVGDATERPLAADAVPAAAVGERREAAEPANPPQPPPPFDPEESYAEGLRLLEEGRHEESYAAFLRAAEAGHAGGMEKTADCLKLGRGVPEDDAAARPWYRKAADLGYADAQLDLGFMFHKGNGGDVDLSAAERLYRAAAEQGREKAMLNLAALLYEGVDGTPDLEGAVGWYRRAADLGSGEATRNLGLLTLTGQGVEKSKAKGLELLHRAAELDDVGALTQLAKLYAAGKLVERDPARAEGLWRRAAELKDPKAMYKLALILIGKKTLAGFKEAFDWLEAATELGDPEAPFSLALLYEKGEGVPQDLARAVSLYRSAAERGNVRAMVNLGMKLQFGLGAERDRGAAAGWYRRAAEGGQPKGMSNLARMLVAGAGVTRDLQEGRRWHQLAAEKGEVKSMFELGQLLAEGKGGPANAEQARAWLQRAAEKGHVEAMVNLGSQLLEGEGGPKDPAGARGWYRRAAEAGHPMAMHNLGSLLFRGLGGERDLDEAERWLRPAATESKNPQVRAAAEQLLERIAAARAEQP